MFANTLMPASVNLSSPVRWSYGSSVLRLRLRFISFLSLFKEPLMQKINKIF